MKPLWSVFAMLFFFTLAPMEAEAKKFGGGKSFGSSQQTAPAPTRPDAVNPPANAGKKGMMGGLLGGLLAGGLLAALIGSDAFEGIQFMDIMIIGLIAVGIFFLLRRKAQAAQQQPAPAYSPQPPVQQSSERSSFDTIPPARNTLLGPNSSSGSAGGFTASVPYNLPAGFDLNGFLVGAREHYRTLQDAWNKNDLARIQQYVTPSLYNELREERATLPGDQHTEVLFVDAEMVRADHTDSKAELSIKFSGRYRDSIENQEEDITDIWHLHRDLTCPDAPWLIVGIES